MFNRKYIFNPASFFSAMLVYRSVVGGFFPHPFEKYAQVKIGSSSPGIGVKITCMWNHHLEDPWIYVWLCLFQVKIRCEEMASEMAIHPQHLSPLIYPQTSTTVLIVWHVSPQELPNFNFSFTTINKKTGTNIRKHSQIGTTLTSFVVPLEDFPSEINALFS